MKKSTIWPRSFWRTSLELIIRELILLGSTVLISIGYKAIIQTGIFGLISNVTLCRIIFCAIELLLLIVYWNYTYVFMIVCDSRTNSIKECYLWTSIVFVVFCAVYWLSYFYLDREMFMWLFRITINLIGVRFLTYAPDNIVPYMIIYTFVMFIIMYIEPLIDYWFYKSWRHNL